MFSALRQHSTIYILFKGEKPRLVTGKVESVSEPQQKIGTTMGAFGQNYQSFVNIVATDPDGNRYEFPGMRADLSIENKACNGQMAVISESRDAMISEVEGMLSSSKNIIDSLPYHESIVANCQQMLSALNPQIAKEQERDREISELKDEFRGMKNSIQGISEMLNTILKNNNQQQP
ncbi:MAG: hypothetical protein E7110_01865 [Bacteroidales bacterium]|nr:hypothetical protein [Bacteroidales bacterium]